MTRRRLLDRRESPGATFEHCGREYQMTVGLYAGGAAGEIFLRGAKVGSDMDALLDDAATLASLLLQERYPPAELARRLTVDGLMRAALELAADMTREEAA
jgi:hypothetical protein